MPLPQLTDQQRKDALVKAAEARKKRAELKAELSSGHRFCLTAEKTVGIPTVNGSSID